MIIVFINAINFKYYFYVAVDDEIFRKMCKQVSGIFCSSSILLIERALVRLDVYFIECIEMIG